jgi:hypothetical protein
MKKKSLKLSLCLALSLAGAALFAREDVNHPPKGPKASFKDQAGDCTTPSAQFDLEINNVRARILTGGDAWWNLSEARYEVPKSDGSGLPLNALFAGAIWISGFDAGGNLKVAAQRYRQGGDDYWPGPVSNAGTVDKATCNKYDRFFNVFGANIDKAQTAFAAKGNATTVADIPKDVLAWPGKGNPYLSTDPSLVGETFIVNDNLAPFFDFDNNGEYDPTKGDYPYIPCVNGEAEAFADQMVFWVFNDVGNQHSESSGQAIGVQINALAFAFQTTDDINNMTFYKYQIVNKTSNPLFQTYITQWSDPDLGCFSNDRVGCDTTRSLGIVYNNNTDAACNGVAGYGSELPLIGIDFFEGPIGDDSTQLGLSSFVYFTNGASFAQSDPGSAAQYRNYMTGLWADGTPFTEGGTGYNSGGPQTEFIFPGNPVDPNQWSEMQPSVASQLQAGDRRMVQTSGPFTLKPGASQYVTVGVVFVQPAGGVGAPPNFETTIGPADDKAQALFNTCFNLVDGPDAPTLNIREASNELVINLINSPSSNNFGEGYNEVDGNIVAKVNSVLGGNGDSTYTFEGYKIYQVTSSKVSATELEDPTKALLVAQVDVKNGISNIINVVKDNTLGMFVPVLKVEGKNEGITNSFRITEDLFATGTNKKLVNHKTYYFTAIAYAHNDWRTYNQNNPQQDAQLTPYLQGRGNFKIYSAIPHIADPRNSGTVLNSEWGEGVEVKRIEGQGNGGNNLNLSPETVERIINSGSFAFSDTLNYVKGFDPIGFQVTDPISLREADFDLDFEQDSFYTVTVRLIKGSADTSTFTYQNIISDWANNVDSLNKYLVLGQGFRVDAILNTSLGTIGNKWKLTDLTNNVTILSDRYNDRPYQQQIFYVDGNGERQDYGFSLKLGTPAPYSTIPVNYPQADTLRNKVQRKSYSAGASSLTYQNPLEPWLSFVKDEGTVDVTNWIRSGIDKYDPAGNGVTGSAGGVFDDNWYYTGTISAVPTYPEFTFQDSAKQYDNFIDGTWGPYCLTANYAKRNLVQADLDANRPPFVYGPGFKWRNYGTSIPPQNTLDRLSSVDIVITPDRSKWTRCIVFETGEDEGINLGNELFPRSTNPNLASKGALKGQMRMAISKVLDSNGNLVTDPTLSDTGRSYFPGYAINVETGERLNICFGESSDQGDQNGRDMLWNPTDKVFSPINFPGSVIPRLPYFGGKHFIYVMDTKYDEGVAAQRLLYDNYDKITNVQGGLIPPVMHDFYRSLMWTSIPYLTPGYEFAADGNGSKYIPPAEVTVKLRVEKPFNRQFTNATGAGDSLPRYQFSTKGLGAKDGEATVANNALDLIRVVPNPYLAYSAYETDQNSNKVKITNLPNTCSITIYATDGTIIRKLSRAIGVDPSTQKRVEISDGSSVDKVNIDNSIDWDMKNNKGITISSGMYLIHVEAPGIGERTLKWFGALRPADTSNF